jgi:lipopolysaccharide/colanic/teichoic acid biosynthesis glycosyltransferase
MNRTQQSIQPTPEAAARPKAPSHPSESSNCGPCAPTDSAVALPLQLLTWSGARNAVHGGTENGAHASPFPRFCAEPRDRGFWLLRGAFTRREGWLRLSAEMLANERSYRLVDRPTMSAVKRLCDVALSFALLVLLSPLFVLIAALVKLDSPGPAFFRQWRVGRDGTMFLLWKFRSMRADSPKYARSPTRDLDRRLTRFGRLIRRISADELPQLINVLKGEMSLVGPRPEMPFIVEKYTALQRHRLAVNPGITGLWQVSPARAYPIHENLHYDLHYIHHQNIVLDGVILLRTIAAVVRGVGAV